MKNRIIKFLATGAYAGLLPMMPGTFGTLVGIPLAYALSFTSPTINVATIIVGIMAAAYVSGRAEEVLGRKDPPSVVIDEIIGYLVTICLLPFTTANVISAFLLFRFFDIVKPYPIRTIEKRVPGGFGVVLDDIVAGIMASVTLRIINYFIL